jgi:hypothetical protein
MIPGAAPRRVPRRRAPAHNKRQQKGAAGDHALRIFHKLLRHLRSASPAVQGFRVRNASRISLVRRRFADATVRGGALRMLTILDEHSRALGCDCFACAIKQPGGSPYPVQLPSARSCAVRVVPKLATPFMDHSSPRPISCSVHSTPLPNTAIIADFRGILRVAQGHRMPPISS